MVTTAPVVRTARTARTEHGTRGTARGPRAFTRHPPGGRPACGAGRTPPRALAAGGRTRAPA
ncbi:hypothetical protein GCM10018793_70450 [Streptomyces sulfonofaciens]|uniref:Uncharacterized protein n=1 Tax=Streptomyces sulfonofaciens TaxID=68272 RepID=A0A919L9V0_9ACTN|nr:hypothetical protein GCM10018793_70450 [Streptomyces sulfonofaciens]